MARTETTFSQKEIRAFADPDSGHYIREAVNVKAGSGAIDRGTILGIETSSGLYKPYSASNTDGSEKAECILAEAVDASGSSNRMATAYWSGVFWASKLATFDDGAVRDLKAQYVPPGSDQVRIR